MGYRMLGVVVPPEYLESYAHETLADWKSADWDDPAIAKMADMFLEHGYSPDTVVGQYYPDEMDMSELAAIVEASDARDDLVVVGELGSGYEDLLQYDPVLNVVHHSNQISVVWIPVLNF